MAIKKANMITQIVRLKQVVQHWKNKSLMRRRSAHASSSSDSDESAAPKCQPPSGKVGVYVGPDRIRFVIRTRFLNFPAFVALLDKAEEEFGFQRTGGLVLPCEPSFLGEIVRLLEEDEEKFRGLGLDEFLNMVSFDKSLCKESSASYSFSPLLPKSRA